MEEKILAATLLLSLFLGSVAQRTRAHAQPADAPRDSVVYAYLPYIRYDSDIGFEGGFSTNRYHYVEGTQPFNTLTELRLRATTRGLFNTRLAWEATRPLGTQVRSRVEVLAERRLNDIFFPLGNDTSFEETRWEDGYYYFDSYRAEATYEGRLPLQHSDRRLLDVLVRTGGIVSGAFGDNAGTSLAAADPRGRARSALVFAGVGLLHDSRDSEFDPRTGHFARLELIASPGSPLSSYQMAEASVDTRWYRSVPVLEGLTVAARLNAKWTTGDVPFWRLPEAGGEESVRGYPTGRFRDRGAVVTNLELRQWIAAFDWQRLRLGATAFTDAGRVFSSVPSARDLFREYHRTYGGGLTLSAFTPDFIVRAQLGRSDELSRIYMNIGYTF